MHVGEEPAHRQRGGQVALDIEVAVQVGQRDPAPAERAQRSVAGVVPNQQTEPGGAYVVAPKKWVTPLRAQRVRWHPPAHRRRLPGLVRPGMRDPMRTPGPPGPAATLLALTVAISPGHVPADAAPAATRAAPPASGAAQADPPGIAASDRDRDGQTERPSRPEGAPNIRGFRPRVAIAT